MGKLVAEGKQMPIGEVYTHYEGLLIETLRLKTTVKKNMNVLEHILGYFKEQLSADEKQEMLEVFDQYRREFVPLIVPVDPAEPLCAQVRPAVPEAAGVPEPASGGVEIEESCVMKVTKVPKGCAAFSTGWREAGGSGRDGRRAPGRPKGTSSISGGS